MSEEERRLEITRRGLLGGITATGVATAGVGAGTWAYFQDAESNTGNSVEAGTMDLDLRNGGSGVQFTISGAKPGGISQDGFTAQLHNTGSVAASAVNVDFSNTSDEDGDGDPETDETVVGDGGAPESDTMKGASGMARYVYVDRLEYIEYNDDGAKNENSVVLVNDGSAAQSMSHDHYIEDINENDYIDLDDLAASRNEDALSGFNPPPAGGSPSDSPDGDETGFKITTSFHRDAPNNYQGDILQTEITFTLEQ